ncbi:unnamed protein product [Fraxinus pennsylvanica]|uniref:F-box associated beta-propeller type 1 domain-containing protein n=1 Tax=Fraxinus pennsylvanica TaxID=56036 RepID=A0AAD1Z864_9LAMI|nr:unnamed protein product [Fraxinus pennsylvanica]
MLMRVRCLVDLDFVNRLINIRFLLSSGKNQHAKSQIEGTTFYPYRVVEIHTLGTKSWRNIGFAPSFQSITSPTYLNGVLHWIGDGCSGKDLVLSFEFSSECFKLLPLPWELLERVYVYLLLLVLI